ncbi:MAG: hypothetical protein L0H93_18665 [Nocardioides sp.]|nr:hypothetical protein [Nocardioides sp.]
MARIVVQPPRGKTLVNFETILGTEAEEFTESLQTSEAGIAYERGRPMSDYASHSYELADAVHPRVDVT